ncbi:MAG: amidohydrolase family protein [Clostridiales bacterium]|nr:amidohydrolase family protein [Clostridiales bacterium]
MNKSIFGKNTRLFVAIAVIVSLASPAAFAGNMYDTQYSWTPFADTILVNAQIVTADDDIIPMIKAKEYKVKKHDANYRIIEEGAMAIKDGKILAITDDVSGIAKYKGENTEVLDLAGKVVIPGLMDNHIHATSLGFDLTYGAELTYALTADEVSEAVAANIAKHGWGAGDWVRGYRWDEYRYVANGSPMVNRWDHLDPLTKDGQLVNLARIFMGTIVNTNVFNAMGIYDQDPNTWPAWWLENPANFASEDVIYREPLYIEALDKEVNVPTGAFVGRLSPSVLNNPGNDALGRPLRSVRPPSLTYEDRINSVILSQDRLIEWGTVALWEPGGNNLKVYSEANARGGLKGRVTVMENYLNATSKDPQTLRTRLSPGYKGNDLLGDEHLKIMGVKYSLDGGYTTRGAYMSEPFENWETIEGTPNYGSPGITDFDELYTLCRIVAEAGRSNHIHYCGDAGSRLTVDVYKKLYDEIANGEIAPYNNRELKLDQNGKPDLRWSLIHAYSPLEPKTYILDEVAEYGFTVAGQPIFNYQEIQGWLNNVGLARVERSTPVRSYLEGGVIFAAGTDFTSALPNPWIGIYAMLTRKCQVTGNVYGPNETVGIADAIATMTILPAYTVFDEDWRGSLEVGKAADLVVLDIPDIFMFDDNPELCFEMDDKVLMTMVGGETLYQKAGVTFPSLSLANAANSWSFADTILTNAQVVTVDDSIISMIKAKEYKVKKNGANFPIIENGAVAIKDGNIIAVAKSSDIDPYRGPDTEVIDLKGNVLIPGLMDSHIHATGLGWDLTYGAELTYALTADEVAAAVAENIEKHNWGPGDWVRGYRWDEYRYVANGSPMVNRWKHLDPLTPNGQLVNLGRIFMGTIVNTNVFNAMGIYDQDPTTWPAWWLANPANFASEDVIYREPMYIEALGKEVDVPTGAFVGRLSPGVLSSPGLDAAGRQLRSVRPPGLTYEDRLKSIALSQDRLLEWGTVALLEPSGSYLRSYNEAYDRGWIKGRVTVIENYISNASQKNALRNQLLGSTNSLWDNDRHMDLFGNKHVKAMGVKYSLDGGYTTRGAYMSEPFENWENIEGTPNYGSPGLTEFDDLYDMCRMVAEAGMSNHIHYCGDAGSRLTVDVYKKLYDEILAGEIVPYNGRKNLKLDQNGKPDLRWSLIHAYSPLEPKTNFLSEAADYGFVIAGQPIFNYQEIQGWLNNVGLERVERSTPVRSYLEGGCIFAAGTDYTSALPNPWVGIYAMLSRKCQVTGNVYGPDETVGIADALATMTILGAYSVFDEDWRGSIEVGKAADLVVLNLNSIFDFDKDPELCFDMDNRVLLTMVDGEAVFAKDIVPPPPVAFSLEVLPVSGIEDDVEFTLSIRNAFDVLTVELEFEVDGSMLAGKGVEPLSGFSIIDGIVWKSLGGNVWRGTVTLGYPAGANTGFSAFVPTDIAKFIFAPRAKGDTAMKLTSVEVTGFDKSITRYVDAVIENGEAATTIDQLVYSKYDLNKDNKVDALDLGIMLLYCGFDEDSPNWGTLIKVNDSKGKGVTASMCDVNSDGVIDMLDLLDLFIHYTK